MFKKHYLLSEDGGTAGGVYLWNSRAEAEALYTDAWRAFVREKYGTDPVVTYFDSPVLVDNVANYPKTEMERRFFTALFGAGLIGTDGDLWRRHRRIMAPAFDPRCWSRQMTS